MAEAIVSAVVDQLTSTIVEEIRQEVRLVVGVGDEVEQLKRKLRLIGAVIRDAEQKQVKEEAVGVWLDQLKDTAYDMEDVLDEWQTARLELNDEGDHEDALVSKKKVCGFLPSSCFGFKQVFLCHDIAQKIKKLNEKLDALEREKNNYSLNVIESIGKQGRETTALDIDVSDICGRDTEKKDLLSMILGGSSEAQEGTRIIAIVGSGGMGKTTLAQFAYNNKEVMSNNFDKRIWVCVSDPFEKLSVAKAILEALDGNAPNLNQLDSLMQRIHDRIQGMKFLLVLDDIWTEDYNKWEPFYNCLRKGLHGSTILITTRNKKVACMMKADDFLNLEKLSTEDSWLMFKRIAISGRANEEHERLDEIGKKIVEKCDGLPLAIKVIGSLLRSKETVKNWEFFLKNEMWELEVKEGILPPLLLSYYDLRPEVKSCFLYCATFPKDWCFDRNKLIFLWMAQGYFGSIEDKDVEMIGNECFNTLVSRSFFQEVKNDYENNTVICKIHDIMHDVAVFLSRHECFTVENNNSGRHFNRDRLIRHLWERTPDLTVYADLLKLRSLFLYDNSQILELPPNFFDQFNHLKAFTFSLGCFKEIPREIKRLRQLRLLDISKCFKVRELPDALCELYNLQTLIACPVVSRISEGIGKLVKLRHLIDIYNAITPRGIGRLTSLRTLTTFVIDGGYDNKPCNLECLKNLNHLGGHCYIQGLGDVTDPREVEKAELRNKENLLGLKLDFDRWIGEKADDHNDEHVLEAIQPHPNLESLKIYFYKGSYVLPEWMMSLCKIKNLYLHHCNFGRRLPSLGKLSYLESLSIVMSWVRTEGVRRVSNEFLGIESGGESSSSSKVISFPKLKFLQFITMLDWEVWDYGITRKDDEEFTIMPHLCTLKFDGCPRLKELPQHLFRKTTLEELEVDQYSSQILKEHFEEWKIRRQAQRPSTSI